MEKIAIVGSPGAGKTTLAKDLGSIRKLKVYHLLKGGIAIVRATQG